MPRLKGAAFNASVVRDARGRFVKVGAKVDLADVAKPRMKPKRFPNIEPVSEVDTLRRINDNANRVRSQSRVAAARAALQSVGTRDEGREALAGMSVAELRDVAGQLEVNAGRKRKAELVNALVDATVGAREDSAAIRSVDMSVRPILERAQQRQAASDLFPGRPRRSEKLDAKLDAAFGPPPTPSRSKSAPTRAVWHEPGGSPIAGTVVKQNSTSYFVQWDGGRLEQIPKRGQHRNLSFMNEDEFDAAVSDGTVDVSPDLVPPPADTELRGRMTRAERLRLEREFGPERSSTTDAVRQATELSDTTGRPSRAPVSSDQMAYLREARRRGFVQASPGTTGRGNQRNAQLDDLVRAGLMRRSGRNYTLTDAGRERLKPADEPPPAVNASTMSADDKLRVARIMFGDDESKWPAHAKRDAAKLRKRAGDVDLERAEKLSTVDIMRGETLTAAGQAAINRLGPAGHPRVAAVADTESKIRTAYAMLDRPNDPGSYVSLENLRKLIGDQAPRAEVDDVLRRMAHQDGVHVTPQSYARDNARTRIPAAVIIGGQENNLFRIERSSAADAVRPNAEQFDAVPGERMARLEAAASREEARQVLADMPADALRQFAKDNDLPLRPRSRSKKAILDDLVDLVVGGRLQRAGYRAHSEGGQDFEISTAPGRNVPAAFQRSGRIFGAGAVNVPGTDRRLL